MEIEQVLHCALILAGIWARASATGSQETPELHKIYIDTTLGMGDKVDIMCSLKRGSQPISFTWYKDNRPVRTGQDGYNLLDLNGKSILVIERIERKHIGNYTCTASNEIGSDSYTVPVVVEAPPSWSLAPSDTTAPTGSKVFVHCTANGFPQPSVHWTRQEKTAEFVPIQESDRIKLLRNGTLSISLAKVQDAGLYRCEAVNKLGNIKQTLSLTVSAPPVIIEHNDVTTIRRSHTIKMLCEATGDAPMTLIWTKDERLYQNTYVEGYDIIQRVMPGGIRSELMIHNTTPGDAGTYTCKVSNPFGKAEAHTKLQVLEPPFAPLAIRITNIESKQVRLNWQAPISVVSNYIVRYWREGGHNGGSKNGRKLSVNQYAGTETSAYIADLHPGTTYSGYMLSENGVGTSGESGGFKFTTREEAPTASPLDVKLVGIGAKFFKIQWKSVPEDHTNGKVLGYNIGHKQFDSDVPFTFETVQGEPGEAIVRGVKPNTKYSVVIHAFNQAGSGPASHRLVVQTLDKDLPGPPNFVITHVTASAVSVQIKEKIITNHVTQFVLSYREVGSDTWKSVFFPAHTHNLNVEGLHVSSKYELTIASYSVHGRGESSKPMTFTTTSQGLPSPMNIMTSILPPKEGSNMILTAHSGFLTAQNMEAVLSEPKLFLPLLFSLTLVVSSIVTAYACYKRIVAKYTVFNNPTGAPVIQYQTVQGAYGVLDREYCVLQQKLYGLHGGYYGVNKNGEVVYDMPYDAVINTSLPLPQQESSSAAEVGCESDQQPKDCYTMLKGKDNRQSFIVAPAVPEKDEALRATLRAEKAEKIKKEFRSNGAIIHADIHSSEDLINDDIESERNGTFIQPTENSDPEDTDNDGDDLEPDIHTEPTDLGTSSIGDSNADDKGESPDECIKLPLTESSDAIESEAPPAIPKKTFKPQNQPNVATTPIHLIPDLPPPDDYDINWPAPPPPEGI